jgi:hypothetical protein
MAWWNDRIRIAATVSIAGWVIVLVVGMSIMGLLAFGDWSGWIKWVLGMAMMGAAGAALEGLLRTWRGLGISSRGLDVAMMLILLGIGCWALLSSLLSGKYWVIGVSFLVGSARLALRVWLKWKE